MVIDEHSQIVQNGGDVLAGHGRRSLPSRANDQV